MRIVFIKTLSFLFLSTCLFAGMPVDIGVKTSLLVDKSKSLDLTNIIHMNDQFHEVVDKGISLKPQSGNAWVAVEVKNQNSVKQQLVLELENRLINPVFYKINPTTNDKRIVGTQIDHVSKHSAIYPFDIEPEQTLSFLIKIETCEFPLAIQLFVREASEYGKHNAIHTMTVGFIIGIVFIIILFSTVIGVVSRNKNSILFALFILVTSIYFFVMEGFMFIFYGYSKLNQYVVFAKATLPVALGLLGMFLNNFFEINNKNTKLHKVFKYSSLSFVSLILIYIIFRNNPLNLYLASYIVVAIGVLLSGFIIVYAKTKKATYVYPILFALSVFIIFLFVKLLLDFGYILPYPAAVHSLKIGFAFLMLGIILSISYRYKDQAVSLKEMNLQLDTIVKERTAEINNQNEELKTQTEELNSQREELEMQKEELESQKEELIRQKDLLQKQNNDLEKLQLAASKTDNVIYIFNPDGTLVWFNKSFSSKLGLEYNEYIKGDNKEKIYNISSNHDIGAHLGKCLLTKSKVIYESRNKDSLDRELWFQTTLTPIFQDNEIKYIVAIDSDITQIKQYELEVEHQRNLAIIRKNELEFQQNEMVDSLRYAQRIQTAILPQSRDIRRFFPESFILFEPRDIVSGDFYWFHRIDNKFVFIVVDCTGHGVPGAFMSIIGTYLLNSIIIQNNETSPAEILKQLNRKLKISLKNENPARQTNDGMDVSLAVLDTKNRKLSFAGALRPLFLCRKNNFVEIKGDKIPITSEIAGNVMAQFKESEFEIEKGDRFYMFTDGITDQFGGKENKKFLTKRFMQLIIDSQSMTMDEQLRLIIQTKNEWRGKNDQIDDILVLGVQI